VLHLPETRLYGTPSHLWQCSKYSEQYGLTVYLCPECHRTSDIAVHRNKEVRTTLQRIGQRTFEKKCGSREEFVRMFGKNYLEDKL
jgi:hypothetical protein